MACTDPLRRSILDSNSKGPALTGGGISAVIAKSPEFKIFNDCLRSRGMKFSQPRKTILKLFLDGESHKDIEELILEAKKIDSLISRSTVYRTMNLLVTCGLADEINFNGERKYFENVSKKHHHDHFFCTKCVWTVYQFQKSSVHHPVT